MVGFGLHIWMRKVSNGIGRKTGWEAESHEIVSLYEL